MISAILCLFLSSLWVKDGIVNRILNRLIPTKVWTDIGDYISSSTSRNSLWKKSLWPVEDRFAYLTVGMVAERLVRFVDDHTLDLLGRTRLS